MRAEFIDNNYMIVEHGGYRITVMFDGPTSRPIAVRVNIRHEDGTVLRAGDDNWSVRLPELEIEAVNSCLVL